MQLSSGSATLSCAQCRAPSVSWQCISMWEIVSSTCLHSWHVTSVALCLFKLLHTIVAVGYASDVWCPGTEASS
eukprot:3053053-Rhodomonas_salina.1